MNAPSAPGFAMARQREVVAALREVLPTAAVLFNEEDTRPYECDGLSAYRQLPMVVALPENEAQVIAVLNTCRRLAVQIVPRGAGTSLSGGALPLALFGVRWSSGFGDVSAAGTLLSNLLFRVAHAGFLALAVVMALDLPFSPRALGYGQAMLPFYYLGALVIGYCAGYFLLVCGAQEEKAWQKPGPLGKALNFVCVAIIWLGLVVLPGWLVMKNLPSLRAQNGPAVREFAAQLAKGLPGQGALALSEQPTHLLLVAAHFHGQASPHLLLDARMLQLMRYHRQLAKRQYTWLRAEPAARWLDPGAAAGCADLVGCVGEWILQHGKA